jgi:hypothetical protein
VAEKASACPVDFKLSTPAQAKAAIEQFMGTQRSGAEGPES